MPKTGEESGRDGVAHSKARAGRAEHSMTDSAGVEEIWGPAGQRLGQRRAELGIIRAGLAMRGSVVLGLCKTKDMRDSIGVPFQSAGLRHCRAMKAMLGLRKTWRSKVGAGQ